MRMHSDSDYYRRVYQGNQKIAILELLMTMIWVTVKKETEWVVAREIDVDKIEIICGAALGLFPTITVETNFEMCGIYVW